MATGYKTVDEEISRLPSLERAAESRLARLRRVGTLPERPNVLDLGSGVGGYVVAFSKLGCTCNGLEPWESSRANALAFSERLGIPVPVREGVAELIPLPDEALDLVHASSVIEHVEDVDRAFDEIYRVLKPGGIFWFDAASSLCPIQQEISAFPLFGWYPDRLKLRIMRWAKMNRPQLIRHTDTPAINWFTPAKARRLLRVHGFRSVYDRWELRGEDEGGKAHRLALRIIRASRITKLIADVLVSGCSYAAIK